MSSQDSVGQDSVGQDSVGQDSVGQGRVWGRFETVLCLATGIAICSFVAGTLLAFAPNVEPGATGVSIMVAAAGIFVAIGAVATLVLLLTANLWLLMGNARVTSRLFVVAMTNVVPCTLFVVGAAVGLLRFENEGEIPLLFSIFSQRLMALLIFALLGSFLQFFAGWRIVGPLGKAAGRSESGQPFQASIGDIMVLTAVVAGILGCFTYWVQVFDADRRGQRLEEDFLLTISMVTLVEICVVLVLLLFPIFLSFGAPWIRRHYPSTVVLWTCLCGTLGALLFCLIDASLVGGILFFCVPFAMAVFFVLWLEARAGFRFAFRGMREMPEASMRDDRLTSSLRPRWRWFVRGGCLFALVAVACFYMWFDLPVLIESGDFSAARKFAWMTRNEGAFPGGWEQGMSLGAAPRFRLRGDSKKLTRMIRAVVPTGPALEMDLHINDKVSRELLDELSQRSLFRLKFSCVDIDDADFDEFCKKADVSHITLESESVARLRSLRHIKNLASVELGSVVAWTEDYQKVFADLAGVAGGPSSLRLRLVDGELGDTVGLQSVSTLVFVNSLLTEQTPLQLARLKNLKMLQLVHCDLTPDAAEAFSQLQLDDLVWDDSDEGRPKVSDQALLQLASSCKSSSLRVTTQRGIEFATKLQNKAASEQLLLDGIRPNDNVTRPAAPAGKGAATDDILERWATEFVRDDRGEFVELDLQEVPVQVYLDRIPELKSLRRLRVGHATQTKKTFDVVSKMDSLRELEISGYRVDAASFRRICRMKNLLRLQLPMCPAWDYWNLRHPEEIPFTLNSEEIDNSMLSELWLQTSNTSKLSSQGDDYEEDGYGYGGFGLDYGGYGYDPYGGGEGNFAGIAIDEDEFQMLANLTDLEYLFLPGFLITEENIETIQQLSKLKELHALLSIVDARLLRQIGKLQNLESLSIGTMTLDAAFLQSLGDFRGLRTFQLVFFNDAALDSLALQGQLTAQLKKVLPGCDVHVFFAPSPEW